MDSWEDPFDVVGKVDAFILGARMYPDMQQDWQAVLDNPKEHAAVHRQARDRRGD